MFVGRPDRAGGFKQIWNTLAVLEYLGACDLAQDRQGIVDHRRTRVVRGKRIPPPRWAQMTRSWRSVSKSVRLSWPSRLKVRMPARRLGFRGLCRRTPGIPDRPSCSHWTRSAMSLPTRSMPTSSNSPRLASRPSRRACSGCRIRSASCAPAASRDARNRGHVPACASHIRAAPGARAARDGNRRRPALRGRASTCAHRPWRRHNRRPVRRRAGRRAAGSRRCRTAPRGGDIPRRCAPGQGAGRWRTAPR